MKELFYLSSLLLFFIVVGCSDDDSEINTNTANYFPLANNNAWTYTNQLTVEEQVPQEDIESLTAVDAGNNIYAFEREGGLVVGFATAILTNGQVVKQDNSLLYNGVLSIDFSDFGTFPIDIQPIELTIENAKLYDKNANVGANLFLDSNQVVQELNYQGQSFDLVIDYQISLQQKEHLDTYSVSTEEFADVLTSKMSVTIAISADIGFVSIPLLNETEVIQSTNYFAKDVGLIYNKTQYDISTEARNELNIPSLEYHSNLSQAIQSYSFN